MKNSRALAWALLLPALAPLLVFAVFPAVQSLWLSFHEMAPFSRETTAVGWENYRLLWSSPEYWRCVQVSCLFTAYTVIPSLLLSLGIALALDSKVDAGVPEIVNSDESRIRQILTNLIGNALKFTERGGVSLEVSCARGEPMEPGSSRRVARLFFAVKDSGIGIPADKMDHLFMPFSQVDTSSTRRRGGTGLGLIISKRLCELMGGTISVESRPGEGSTFRFSILTDFEES